MKKYLKLLSYALVGSVLGYAYYYYVGCTAGGTCPLTSQWYITTGYGFVAGILMGLPGKGVSKNGEKQKGNNQHFP